MKTLLITLMLFLGYQTDTSKKSELATFNKIDHQVAKLKSQEHSNEDIYKLQMKSFKTLTESHALTRVLLLKIDSQKSVIESNHRQLKIMNDKQNQLEFMIAEYQPYKERMIQIDQHIQNWTMLCAAGCIILFLIRIAMKEHVKRKLQH